KPPSNHPQVMFFAFSRSPTFVPTIETMLVVCNPGFVSTHSSPAGRGSPMTAPVVAPFAMLPDALAAAPLGLVGKSVAVAVVPAIKLRAPTEDGPNIVP